MKQARISLTGDRPDNQDRCAILHHQNSLLMIMADGLGGHPHGDVAAQALLDVCEHCFQRSPKPVASPRLFFHQCALRTHERIRQFIQERSLDDSPRTTVMLILVQDGLCHWAYTGDSRFYLIRDGVILHQSVDHTLGEEDSSLQGTIAGRALTRCLGGLSNQSLASSQKPIPLQAGDILLACSDGFWAQLPEALITRQLSTAHSLEQAIQILGQHARESFMDYSDNISAIALQLEANDFDFPVNSGADNEQEDDLLASIDQLEQLIQAKLHFR